MIQEGGFLGDEKKDVFVSGCLTTTGGDNFVMIKTRAFPPRSPITVLHRSGNKGRLLPFAVGWASYIETARLPPPAALASLLARRM